MRADPADQIRLLDLAAHDAALDRLAHRRRSLPALAVLAAAAQELAGVDRDAVVAETEIEDLSRAQRKLENDVDAVRLRSQRDRDRLDTGAVGNAKELSNLSSEIDSLGRRQADLEDQVLEVMEVRESAEARLAALRAEQERLRQVLADAAAERDAAFTDIDADTARLVAERTALAPSLPADLVRLYERLRADNGGVGAAALIRRRCEGCHLEMSGAELVAARDAAPDEVLRCEQCGRILVRTAESGLGSGGA
jgi:predicted  nucleic acid-binding Zn-ribbon protein